MGQNKRRGATTAASPPRPKLQTVTELAVVEAVCAQPIQVGVLIRGQAFQFEGQRLRPYQTKEVQLLLESALPPVLEGSGAEPKYDLTSPEYLVRKETNRRRARALAVWWGYPVFRKQAQTETPNAKLPEAVPEIEEWMEKRSLEDDVLETLFLAVYQRLASELDLRRYADFTSGNNSPES